MTLAKVRDDLVDKELAPPIKRNEVEKFLPRALLGKAFECEQPDELDDEEYNMICTELESGYKFACNSIDFEFV